jgi:hypothetical protein
VELTASAASKERKNGSKTAACQIDHHRFVAWLNFVRRVRVLK